MEQWSGCVALITGGRGGLGTAITQTLLRHGLTVVAFDKVDTSQVAYHRGENVYHYVGDVTKEDEVKKAFLWIENSFGRFDILINCAGIANMAPLISSEPSLWKEMLDVNILGLSICTKEAIILMTKCNVKGYIIHINSIVGHYFGIVPELYMYTASKHAVTVLAEGIRRELVQLGSKIKITSISPGLIDTQLAANVLPGQNVKEMPHLAPQDVADAIIYVLCTPDNVQVHEMIIRPVGETQ